MTRFDSNKAVNPKRKHHRISLKVVHKLLREFAIEDHTAKTAADVDHANVDRNTANHHFNRFRTILYNHFSKSPRFAGEVEMDRAQFGKGIKRIKHDERVAINRMGLAGDPVAWAQMRRQKRKPNNKVLVFGILRRGGDVYTHIIQKANKDTLDPIIHLVVEPKTTIYTDKWAAFESLKIDGYVHKSVNHELGPVGVDGAHTGGIDAFWAYAKFRLSRFRGLSRRTFPLHLKECEVRYNMRNKSRREFHSFMKRLVFPKKSR